MTAFVSYGFWIVHRRAVYRRLELCVLGFGLWGQFAGRFVEVMTYRVAHRRYQLPFKLAVRTAHGAWAEREGVWVRMEDERGNVGFGEAAPIPWFGTESVDDVEEACHALGEIVDDDKIAQVPQRLPCLRNALASAMAQLESAREAADGSETSTASTDEPAYLQIAALLPGGRAVLDALPTKAEAGFRVFKWKVGVGEVADELSLLDDVCSGLPEGSKLRLDANGAWDRRRAEQWLERCAERPVEFIEQPVASDARGAEDLLLGLANDYPTPVGLDESLVGEGDVARWLELGWPGIFIVKTALLGDAREVLDRLSRAKARVVFSSALETAIGARAALEHAFAWHGERRALGFGVWPLFADARLNGPAAAPFLRREDVARIDREAAWNALS